LLAPSGKPDFSIIHPFFMNFPLVDGNGETHKKNAKTWKPLKILGKKRI
jgi:hypothetical protein